MKKPEIEVVRFGAEDVIATSGYGQALVDGNQYFTRGTEAIQAGVSGFHSRNGNFYIVSGDNYYSFMKTNGKINSWAPYTYNQNANNDYFYAWYNNANTNERWGTDQLKYSDYKNNGIDFPGGVDNKFDS